MEKIMGKQLVLLIIVSALCIATNNLAMEKRKIRNNHQAQLHEIKLMLGSKLTLATIIHPDYKKNLRKYWHCIAPALYRRINEHRMLLHNKEIQQLLNHPFLRYESTILHLATYD